MGGAFKEKLHLTDSLLAEEPQRQPPPTGCCRTGSQPSSHSLTSNLTTAPQHLGPHEAIGTQTRRLAQGPMARMWLSQEAEGELRLAWLLHPSYLSSGTPRPGSTDLMVQVNQL